MSYERRFRLLKIPAPGGTCTGTKTGPDAVEGGATVTPPSTDPLADAKSLVMHAVVTDPTVRNADECLEDEDVRHAVRQSILDGLREHAPPLSSGERSAIVEELSNDILGYGPLQTLLDDDSITEIMVNGPDHVYVERMGCIERAPLCFQSEQHLLRIIDRIVTRIGRRIDESSPMVDARLPNGSRINAIIPPLALDGACLTVRKFRREPFRMDDLVRLGTISTSGARFVELAIAGGANILVSGGTGTGKTTTLNVLSAAIPDGERIVTIEDSAELQLHQEHVIRLEARPSNIEGVGQITIRDLVRNCLRMRPDRIIVGECRGAETVDMLQAMNTGHDGCMTTLHANSPRDAMARMETLVLTAGVDLPVRAIREQIASAFDLIVHLRRLVDGSRRVTHITEVAKMEGEVITLQDVFVARHSRSTDEAESRELLAPLEPTGIVPATLDKTEENGIVIPHSIFTASAKRSARQSSSASRG